MKRLLSFLLLVVMCATALFTSCDLTIAPVTPADPVDDPTTTPTTYKVMVSEGNHFTITTTNPLEVEKGSTATFTISIETGYTFKKTSAGSFDSETGVLTVENVTKKATITFEVEQMDYDPTKEYTYTFNNAEVVDTTSVTSGSVVKGGDTITVKSKATTKNFIGWSFNAPITLAKDAVSTNKEYTFVVKDEVADTQGTSIKLYANYATTAPMNIITYSLNGGSFSLTEYNAHIGTTAAKTYFSTNAASNATSITHTYNTSYTNFCESLPTIWDCGCFYRTGYVLKEYNTKADGTGVGYSLGSKVYMPSTTGTLYCIWQQQTSASQFTTADVTINKNSNWTYAEDWQASGVTITEYTGTDETVCIPDKINGKYVISISANAFASNTTMKTIVLPRHIQKIEDDAFNVCTKLSTIYLPDGIAFMTDNAFSSSTLANLHHVYLNAVIAPRYTNQNEGAFCVKLSRVLASQDQNRIIVIGGSSAFQGLSTAYLEALLEGDYRVVEFGTTRTCNGLLYVEALANYTHEGDLVLLAPENSTYMMGETELYYKTLRDIETMYNIYRYVDMSNYTHFFNALADLNANYRYKMYYRNYEQMCALSGIDKYGDKQQASARGTYVVEDNYTNSYFLSMNEYFKNTTDYGWSSVSQQTASKDYKTSTTWSKITDEYYTLPLNNAILGLQETGCKVYFSFAPTDANAINEEAQNVAWLQAYDQMILENFEFDGLIGSSVDYVFNHQYFFDCAFHLNDYGRTYRTYQLYKDLCATLEITEINGLKDVGTSFTGCKFEADTTTPIHTVAWLQTKED